MASIHRIDNGLEFTDIVTELAHMSLSKGALRLYTHLFRVEQDSIVKDEDLQKRFKCSKTTLMRRKQELKESGLLDVRRVRLGGDKWRMYLWLPQETGKPLSKAS